MKLAINNGLSQVALRLVKTPANARDVRDIGSILVLGRCPQRRKSCTFALRIHGQKPGRLPFLSGIKLDTASRKCLSNQ